MINLFVLLGLSLLGGSVWASSEESSCASIQGAAQDLCYIQERNKEQDQQLQTFLNKNLSPPSSTHLSSSGANETEDSSVGEGGSANKSWQGSQANPKTPPASKKPKSSNGWYFGY
jgi:hypothetical protein